MNLLVLHVLLDKGEIKCKVGLLVLLFLLLGDQPQIWVVDQVAVGDVAGLLQLKDLPRGFDVSKSEDPTAHMGGHLDLEEEIHWVIRIRN